MPIKFDLEQGVKDAMKAHDEDKKRVFRMALASIKFFEKEHGKTLDENEATVIIQKEIKIRKETLEEAKKAARTEMISEVEKEILLLESFLPKQLSSDELKKIVSAAILEVNAKNAADMGKVMKVVLPQVNGRAANDAVSKTVKELLFANE
jgi:hypothetical protein